MNKTIFPLLAILATIIAMTATQAVQAKMANFASRSVQARTQGDVEYDQGYNSGIRDGQSAALSGAQFNDHGCLGAGNSGSYCFGYKVGYRIGFSGSQLLN